MMKDQTIILLHGWGKQKSTETYYHQTSEIFRKKGFTVYAPDMPGFGKSPKPAHPFTLADYADFVRSFIAKHHIQKPILIGHSFGGRVALKYVSRDDTGVQAVVLAGTPGYSPVSKIKWIASLIISKIGAIVFSLPGLSRIADKVRERYYFLIGARDFYRAEGAMRQTFKNIVGEPLDDLMKAVRVPTLLLWGQEDIIVPVRIAKRMEQTIPQAKLIVFPHGQHSLITDEPACFVDAVVSYLKYI